MRKNRGLAVLLFAILLQMCSAGKEWFVLGIGAVGLIITFMDDVKKG